jgi:replicative DNA helicase
MDDKEYADIIEAMSELSMLPIYIDDTSGIDIESVKIRARHMKIRHNIQLLVIDYLQLIRAGSRKNDGRVQEISEITQSLKAIAKDLNIPVIALSQLSRDVEKRDDKKPQLADLRESGSIEQDADIVMFLYREHYYHERMKPRLDILEEGQEFSESYYFAIKQEFEFTNDNKEVAERVLGQLEKYYSWWKKAKEIENLTEVIVAKNRHGAIGTIRLGFAKEQTKFYNFSSNEYTKDNKNLLKNEQTPISPLNEDLAKELENIF